MAENQKKLHIVMFPWLAFGHMIPFLELSRLIAQKGHKITFISTPKNIDRLPKLPMSLLSLIDFVKIPLPETENLPKKAEATTDLPYHKVKYLKIAYDGLKEPVSKLLHVLSPDWVFFDFAPYWVPEIAAKLSIPCTYFNILNAAFLGFVGPVSVLIGTDEYRKKPEDFTVAPKWVPFETTARFQLWEILRIFNDSVQGDEENIPDTHRIGASISGCDLLVTKSCSEFEPEWFHLLGEIHGKPVLPTGLLPADIGIGSDEKWDQIKDWLDKKEKETVLYVAFGSEAKLTQEDLIEVAVGLELSEIPFFWVLRKQAGLGDTESIELPEGFEERTNGKGVVWTSWAPQPRILSHDSVGGFLTHGGWGSVVDGIQFGRPLVILTFLCDQGINAKILEEKKLGRSIPRDEADGSFTRDLVSESLRIVMKEDAGKCYRVNAKEMSGLFGDKDRQDQYLVNILNHLVRYEQGKKVKVNHSLVFETY